MINRGYRYSQWDGTQSIFDADAEELMDRLSDDLMAPVDVLKALRELFRRGVQDPRRWASGRRVSNRHHGIRF